MASKKSDRPWKSCGIIIDVALFVVLALLPFSGKANAQDQVSLFTPCIDGLAVDANGVATPGNLVSYISWNWSDGTSNQGWFPQIHTYASKGTYTITVTAYYTDGTQASNAENVNVGTGILSNCALVSLSKTSLIFPSEPIGKTSPSQTVTLSNIGNATLYMTSIAATGDFAQTNTCGSSVVAGSNCTITITFTPETSGYLTGDISIADSAINSPQTIALSGGNPLLLTPSKLNFGTQQVAIASLPLNIKITNTTTISVSLSSIKVTGADSGDFAPNNTCGTSLAAGVSCTVGVTFTPGATGTRSGTLVVKDNIGNPQSARLSGVGANLAAGSLSVTISGLPTGTNAQVIVNGPSGYEQPLTQTDTLTGLAAGTYTIIASIVPSSSASNTVYIPSVIGSPTTLSQSAGAAATVTYAKLVARWKTIGPSAISGVAGSSAAGKLQAIAVSNASPQLMFSAGGIGQGSSGPYTEAGIYKSANGGKTWTQQDKGLTDPTVNVLWMDQSNTSIILAGTNFAGIFMSSNSGASWSLIPTGALPPISAFLQVGGTLYAATGRGIAASTDTGKSWALALATTVPVRTLVEQGGVSYAGLDNGQVLVQATPSGQWLPAATPANGTVWSMAVNPQNSQNAFAAEGPGTVIPNLFDTVNEGGAWWPVANMPLDCSNNTFECGAQYVAFDPNTAVLYVGADGPLYQSPNDGNTWSRITSAGWDVRTIIPNYAGVAGNILVASDQGLYLSQDSGTTWNSLNANITSSILYSIGVNGNTILTTAQDFLPIVSFDGGTTWSSGGGSDQGEGGTVIFNPVNSNYAYEFTVPGFEYSADGGHTFTPMTVVGGLGSGQADIIAVDPNNGSTIYLAGSAGIYKSTDWGNSWSLMSWAIPAGPTMVAVSPANSQTIFVGTCNAEGCNNLQNGSLWFTTDGGNNWTESSIPSNCGSPASIAIHPLNPQIILVGMTGGPSCEIIRSADGGVTFLPSTAGLSSMPAHCENPPVPHIQVDPSGSGAVAAGTPGGVYISTDFGVSWTSIRGNTVPFSVTEAIWSGGYLYESTCGEGVLRLSFPF